MEGIEEGREGKEVVGDDVDVAGEEEDTVEGDVRIEPVREVEGGDG